MLDFDEIPRLFARIQEAVDDRNAVQFADCWTEDAVLRIEFFDRDEPLELRGQEQIVGLATGNWKPGETAFMRHLVGTVAVEPIDKTSARAQFYCLYVVPGPVAIGPGAGVYHDLVVWDKDKWRVKRRDHTFFTPIPGH